MQDDSATQGKVHRFAGWERQRWRRRLRIRHALFRKAGYPQTVASRAACLIHKAISFFNSSSRELSFFLVLSFSLFSSFSPFSSLTYFGRRGIITHNDEWNRECVIEKSSDNRTANFCAIPWTSRCQFARQLEPAFTSSLSSSPIDVAANFASKHAMEQCLCLTTCRTWRTCRWGKWSAVGSLRIMVMKDWKWCVQSF